MRVESSPQQWKVGDFWPSRELAFPAASGVACTLVEETMGDRNIPWELTFSRHGCSGSALGLCSHLPANCTFICSLSVLCQNTVL